MAVPPRERIRPFSDRDVSAGVRRMLVGSSKRYERRMVVTLAPVGLGSRVATEPPAGQREASD